MVIYLVCVKDHEDCGPYEERIISAHSSRWKAEAEFQRLQAQADKFAAESDSYNSHMHSWRQAWRDGELKHTKIPKDYTKEHNNESDRFWQLHGYENAEKAMSQMSATYSTFLIKEMEVK